MKFRKKGFENDFFKVVAYILLSIGIFKGYFGRLAWIVKKYSVIVKIYENKKHVRMSCKRTIGKEVGKS
ncbi:hypothetical protein ACU80G_28775 (plasmid) [Bacillus mycoides]|uniref:Uncharacterized protein n=1 Tax=Bacillus cereus MC67 TaxID=1053219 RepID=J8ERQ6_BACCE|nr:hypothetical protein II3_05536 [Bacillus cereus MC67]EOO97817.1 hypothetical protein II1_05621 [Bacillus cereus MC118]